jgi:putative SOS response-associated peptidase YedK
MPALLLFGATGMIKTRIIQRFLRENDSHFDEVRGTTRRPWFRCVPISVRTCTIITGEPNEVVAQIHPRMPVIIPEQHHAAWLGETEDGNLKELLVPYPADQMRMWEISLRVNSPKNDDPSLWEPIQAQTQTTADA